jgi:hypothetical protein
VAAASFPRPAAELLAPQLMGGAYVIVGVALVLTAPPPPRSRRLGGFRRGGATVYGNYVHPYSGVLPGGRRVLISLGGLGAREAGAAREMAWRLTGAVGEKLPFVVRGARSGDGRRRRRRRLLHQRSARSTRPRPRHARRRSARRAAATADRDQVQIPALADRHTLQLGAYMYAAGRAPPPGSGRTSTSTSSTAQGGAARDAGRPGAAGYSPGSVAGRRLPASPDKYVACVIVSVELIKRECDGQPIHQDQQTGRASLQRYDASPELPGGAAHPSPYTAQRQLAAAARARRLQSFS